MATAQKKTNNNEKKIDILKKCIYRLNMHVTRSFVKNIVQSVGRPNNYVPNSVQNTIKG